MLNRILFALALITGAAAPAFAQTASAPDCLPQTGVFSAVQEQGFLQAALEDRLENSRGGTTPAVDCSGSVQEGQLWYNTNSQYTGFPGLGIYDSGAFDYLGYVDRSNHIWMGPIGGGIASISTAATVDPCSVPQNALSLSGPGTITSFGSNCQIGQAKFIAFTASVTIQESASLLTPSGGNISAGTNDQAIIEYTGGGVWRVTFYTPANGVSSSFSVVGGTFQFSLSGATVITVPPGNHTAAMLDVPDQLASGGANFTSYNNGIASGTFTPDCGKGPLQTLTNNGAFNFAPPANDGSCIIMLINGSSAGSVNFTAAWKEGSNTGDALTVTSGSRFGLVITSIAGAAHVLVTAYQP